MSFMNWIDDRFPATKVWNEHLAQYYAPKNFNFWYYFGSFAILVLVIQIVTGIWLTMNYKPAADLAFAAIAAPVILPVEYGGAITDISAISEEFRQEAYTFLHNGQYRGILENLMKLEQK